MTTLAAFQFTTLWFEELLVYVALFATLAASLNLVTGCCGMFSLGHHGFFAVGAYAAGWFTTVLGHVDPGTPAGIAVFAGSAVFAAVAAALAGLVIGLPCLRLRGDYLAIATLAFGEIVRIVVENSPALGGSQNLFIPRVVLEPTGHVEAFRGLFVGIAVALLLVTLVVLRNLLRSAHGRAILSIREDEVASEILGVRTTRYKMRAFLIGSAFAGLAGWLYAHYNGTIAPRDFDLMTGIRILLIVVLGGLGSLSGSVVAAVLLVGLERLLQTGIFGETLMEWMQVEYALVLILLMLLRPNGIFGNRELSDLLRPGRPPRAAKGRP